MASEEETLQGPKFSPPVYQQRYDTVQNLIKIFGSKKVRIDHSQLFDISNMFKMLYSVR